MKLVNAFLLIATFVSVVACSSHTVPYSTNHEDTWFLHKSSMGNTYPIYCRANKADVGAKPVCYEADIK